MELPTPDRPNPRAVDRHRGHRIIRLGPTWLYADTREPVSAAPTRDCGLCSLAVTSEGHDGCLGTLSGVSNACCGHGDERSAYACLTDGTILRRQAALDWFRRRGAGPSAA